jgi:hypothetical protein
MANEEVKQAVEKAMTDLKEVLISEPCLSLPEADNPEFLV